MIFVLGFTLGMTLGTIIQWLFYSTLKPKLKLEIQIQTNRSLENKVWEIFLDDPRAICFNAALIAKYAEISESQASLELEELFFKNKLTRSKAKELGYIYCRNPEALKTFKCKKCGTENKPKQPNPFGSGYSKSNNSVD